MHAHGLPLPITDHNVLEIQVAGFSVENLNTWVIQQAYCIWQRQIP